MKTTLFALCFLCATGAFAQGIAGATLLTNEPQVIEFASHNARATQTDMRMQQNLLGAANPTRAHGERPLWEVMTPAYVAPLGDSARILKEEHKSAKKADIVWDSN